MIFLSLQGKRRKTHRRRKEQKWQKIGKEKKRYDEKVFVTVEILRCWLLPAHGVEFSYFYFLSAATHAVSASSQSSPKLHPHRSTQSEEESTLSVGFLRLPPSVSISLLLLHKKNVLPLSVQPQKFLVSSFDYQYSPKFPVAINDCCEK